MEYLQDKMEKPTKKKTLPMKWEKNGQSARKKQLRFPSTSVEVLKYCKGSTTVLSKKYCNPP